MRVTVALVFLGLVALCTANNHTCAASCAIPQSHWDFTNCDWYDSQLEWLPTAYVKSAKCACHLKGVHGRNSQSSYCVRTHLLASHKAIPDATKDHMRQLKKKHCNKLACSVEYLLYIEKFFIPLAYEVHVNAYKDCCCTKKPAPLIYWKLLMANYKGFVPCAAIVASVQVKGPCGCERW
jgi:hypothetical protein